MQVFLLISRCSSRNNKRKGKAYDRSSRNNNWKGKTSDLITKCATKAVTWLVKGYLKRSIGISEEILDDIYECAKEMFD